MAELIVFLVKEERVAVAGGKGSPTPCFVLSVEKRWQLTLENLDEMGTQEERSIYFEKKLSKDEDNSVLWLGGI